MSDYSDLRKLASTASPGPWLQENDDLYFKDDGYTRHMMTTDSGHDVCGDEDCDDAQRENLKYIAAANPAAVLALIAENEKLKADLREVKYAKLGLSWAIGEIKADNEKLRKDAERYRWIRSERPYCNVDVAIRMFNMTTGNGCYISGISADAQVDSSMADGQ